MIINLQLTLDMKKLFRIIGKCLQTSLKVTLVQKRTVPSLVGQGAAELPFFLLYYIFAVVYGEILATSPLCMSKACHESSCSIACLYPIEPIRGGGGGWEFLWVKGGYKSISLYLIAFSPQKPPTINRSHQTTPAVN